jgi:NAD(P)-dependent dehydrogenase (short-subunit alcohol dehydrogenase family)
LLEPGRRAIFAKLSARVGSIADNRKGGWYGYRASKAALNMLLQTAAVEVHRKQPLWVVAALQPGTVRSPLSRPFVADAHALTPALSVAGMLRALDGLPAQSGAHFVDYRGEAVPW